MTGRLAIAAAAGLIAAVVALLAAEPPKAADDLADEARRAFNRGQWTAAAEAYGQIVEQEPANGRAWFRLGFALHSAGRIEEALEAHLKAAEFARNRGTALYNAACAHALLEHHDEALATLEAAVDAGFSNLRHLRDDPDFEPYREDERYKAIITRLEQAPERPQLTTG